MGMDTTCKDPQLDTLLRILDLPHSLISQWLSNETKIIEQSTTEMKTQAYNIDKDKFPLLGNIHCSIPFLRRGAEIATIRPRILAP